MSRTIERDVSRGAAVNALGLLSKGAGPVFLIAVTRLYGPDALGVYLTSVALIETALAFLVAGFKDGALIFVARHADQEREEPQLYQALITAFAWSILLALAVVIVFEALGGILIPKLYADFGQSLLLMLRWMCLALPLMAVERVIMGATQGLKIMKYEAFVSGGSRHLLLLITASLFWLTGWGISGLVAAYVTTQCIIFVLSALIYHREFHWKPLRHAARHFRVARDMISFAFPQNFNVAFDRFVTNIDVIMLGMMGFTAFQTGFYGAGALIVRELRQIKLVFSSAFSPHIVRLFQDRDLDGLARTFATTSRWIATPLIPIVIGVALLRSDLLYIIHPDFGGRAAVFMLFLLVIPYLQASLGLAGNVVVMTGHSHWNLFNGVSTSVANILLNLLLIPIFGLEGAAIASALTAVLKAVLEVGEMKYILRIRLLVSQMYKPHLAGLVAAAILVAVATFTGFDEGSLLTRVGLLLGVLLLYWGVLLALGGRLRIPKEARIAAVNNRSD